VAETTENPQETAEEKNEQEVITGLLPFTIAGETRVVPELKWRANRDWKAKLQETFLALAGVDSGTPDGLQAMADAERELVLAYDQTHVLGDLEDATEREIDAIYNRLTEVAFPLAASQTALMLAIIRAAAASASESSTSGPSPTGASAAPTILSDHLPSARRSSSSRRRRTA
jgi:hypothetical protein